MIRVIMHGCNGKMGQVITGLCKEDPDVEIVAGIDVVDNRENGYPVFTDINACDVKADVIIDFAAAVAVDKLLDYAVDKQVPVVLCTTGLSPEQLNKVSLCSEKVAILKSANMSLGINTLMKLLKDAANVFAREEFNIVKEKLEDILDVHISNKAIKNSIAVYNENRAACREFSDVAAEYAAVVTPSDRHAVIKARWFMEKSRHTALVKELIAALKAEPAPEFKGKKIIVTGIQVEPYDVLDIFQENGFAIVADDLAQETRNFRQDVPDDDDALMALARAWNEFDGCSLATDANKPKGQMIIDAVKKYGADAVVVCMMKFCDPEEFDYPILLQEFEAAGVKNLYIEVDQESTAFEQVKTRIQTFAEIL